MAQEHQHRFDGPDPMPGLATATALLDCGLAADVIVEWLREDFGLSAGEALVAVEAALREQLQALFAEPTG